MNFLKTLFGGNSEAAPTACIEKDNPGNRGDSPQMAIPRPAMPSSTPSTREPSAAAGTIVGSDEAAYFKRCTESQFEDTPDPRTFSSSPKFEAVLSPLNSQRYSDSLEAANGLIAEFIDFDMVYSWMATAHLKTGQPDKAIETATKGLQVAKRKSLLLSKLGLAPFEKGDVREAVYYWAQAIHSQSASSTDWNPYLYLSYISRASAVTHGERWARALLARADSMSPARSRLDDKTSTQITDLTRRQTSPAFSEVLGYMASKVGNV